MDWVEFFTIGLRLALAITHVKDWDELFIIGLGLALIIIAPPILFSWILRWAWKRWKPKSELRRWVAYTASFAVWLLVIWIIGSLFIYRGDRVFFSRASGRAAGVSMATSCSVCGDRDSRKVASHEGRS